MFDVGSLERIPDQSELYFWADYIELKCLTDPDGQFSLDRLLSKLKFADDLSATSEDALDADDEDVEDLLAIVALEELGEGLSVAEDAGADASFADADELMYEQYGRAAEVRDDRRRWSEDAFKLLETRAMLLGDSYPFVLSADSLSLEVAPVSDSRLLYVFYLCCSSLRYVDKKTESRLTSLFEAASADVMRLLLPSNAEVDLFGTARGLAESRFRGSLYNRICELARELNGTVKVRPQDFHPRDTADNGLDIVGWIPAGDLQPGLLSFFAQCACGTGWKGKQSEASYLQRWNRFLDLTSPPATIVFIPHAFRKAGGHWGADSDVESVLIDRIRAMRLYSDKMESAGTVPIELVRKAWDFRTALV